MWADLKALTAMGSTDARLREIFEMVPMKVPAAEAPPDEWERYKRWEGDQKVRESIESEIMANTEEAMTWSLKNHRRIAAVDLAWDSEVITKERLPLLLYAQGRIDIQTCANSLAGLQSADKFVKKDGQGKVTGIDMPKFIEVTFNLVRSFVTRRLAPQSNKYQNLWPYYKYEARGTDQVSKLRADVMSQESDIIADAYNYREHEVQVMRDTLLYSRSIDFVASKWECEKQMRRKNLASEFKAGDAAAMEFEPQVIKEGLLWANPHPTRIIMDNSEPVTALNSDSGPQFCGYWDIDRWGNISNNPIYWNRESVTYGTRFWDLLGQYPGFQTQYLCNVSVPPSENSQVFSHNIAAQNDKKTMCGWYSPELKNNSVIKTVYFKRLIPKDYRMGEYPYPVWVRFIAASDCRIIYAEFLPSSPAAVCSFNESDQRMVNVSFAMGLLTYADMMSNLITSMLMNLQAELLKLVGINSDALTASQREFIKARLSGKDWGTEPLVVEFSLKTLEELGIKASSIFDLKEARSGQQITLCFQAMTQLLGLIERLEAMSPAEQAQPAPREISATEVAEIASTTSSVSGFFSDAIDNYRAAKKRIIHESALSCKKRRVQVPIVNRYSKTTIKNAGFSVVGDDGRGPEMLENVMITGEVSALDHEFIFTSRDGAERPVNTQSANTLVQLLQVVLQVPTAVQALGRKQLYEMFNEVFRMSGAGVDLKLEVQEGQDDALGEDQMAQLQGVVQQIQQALQQLAEATQKNAQDVAEQEAVNQKQEAMLQATTELAGTVKKSAQDIARIFEQMDQNKKALDLAGRIYRDAPEEAKRAIEQQIGINTGNEVHYIEQELAKVPGAKTSVQGII